MVFREAITENVPYPTPLSLMKKCKKRLPSMDYHTCPYTQNVLSQKWFDLCPQIDEWNILNPLSPLILWQFNAIKLFPGARQLVACAAADNVGNSGSGGRLDWGSLSNPPHAVASCPRAHPCCPFACPSCPFLCPWPMFPFCPVEHPLAYPCCQLAHPTVVLTSSENPDPRIAFGDS